MKARIIVERVPNPHCMVFHATAELSQSPLQDFRRPLRPHSEEYLKEVGEHGAKVVRDVIATPGVDNVTISPYHLQIIKGEAFDWADIEPAIIEALRSLFQTKYEMAAESVEVTEKYEGSKWRSGGYSGDPADPMSGIDIPLTTVLEDGDQEKWESEA